MGNLDGFNAKHYPDQPLDVAPLKPGQYEAVILESEMMTNKAGTGEYLLLTLQVISGEYKGRRLWDRLNLRHPNETAADIAKRTLAAICRATNTLTPKDSCDLHNIPLLVRVVQRRREDTGEVANDIKGYAPLTTTSVVKTAKPSVSSGGKAKAAPAVAADPDGIPW